MRINSNLKKKLAFLLIVAVVAAAAEIGPAWGSRQDRLPLNSAPLPGLSPPPAQAIVDFDGDLAPNRPELTSNGFHKHIHLTLSSPSVTNLHFSTESSQPGRIYAEDIDHD